MTVEEMEAKAKGLLETAEKLARRDDGEFATTQTGMTAIQTSTICACLWAVCSEICASIEGGY